MFHVIYHLRINIELKPIKLKNVPFVFGQVTNFNDWLVANKDKILANLVKKENH